MIGELVTTDIGGRTVAYRRSGQGPPLVLLHGFLCDSRVWRRQLASLSDAFTVLAWDAPGAGASSDPPETFATADFACCLATLLDVVSVARPHVLGISWGGILAQEFYRLFPERVRSLVLADTYAGWKGSLPEHVWSERLASCLADSTGPPEALVAKLLPGMFSDEAPQELRDELAAIVSEFHPVGFRLMSSSSAEMDTRRLLPTIEVPTLLIWGDDDHRSPMHIAEQLHAAIPVARLAVVRNAGHLCNMEQPGQFDAHVRAFLSAQMR